MINRITKNKTQEDTSSRILGTKEDKISKTERKIIRNYSQRAQ